MPTAELIPLAPWLPPITSSVVRPGLSPNVASAAVLSTAPVSAERSGVPVTSHFTFGKCCAHSAKPSNTFVTYRALSRFARPGIAFDSCTNVGIFRERPARIGAVEVKPPIPSTAAGCHSRESALHRRSPFQNRNTKPKIAGEKSLGIPMPASFSMRNSFRPCVAVASISFSEISSITSCPRASRISPTAKPGKRWPPVPPAAMTNFIRYAKGGAVN